MVFVVAGRVAGDRFSTHCCGGLNDSVGNYRGDASDCTLFDGVDWSVGRIYDVGVVKDKDNNGLERGDGWTSEDAIWFSI